MSESSRKLIADFFFALEELISAMIPSYTLVIASPAFWKTEIFSIDQMKMLIYFTQKNDHTC